MTIEEIKQTFGPHGIVYSFSGKKEELETIVGTSYVVLVVNGNVYFAVTDENYTPTDTRMELI
jgi:hypothetical protein